MTAAEIARSFDTGPGNIRVTNFGTGHIHRTYLVEKEDSEKLILQNINTFVFRKPYEMMDNALRICTHLRKKVTEGQLEWEIPEFIPTRDREFLFSDDEDRYWRMQRYIPNHLPKKSFGPVVYKAGLAYGRFIELLSDLPGPPLFATIPHFHDLEFRMGEFELAIREGIKSRIRETEKEISTIQENREMAMRIPVLMKSGKLKLRTTHNDSKIDNILFDEKLNVVSVIDLDTVMPGIVHSDFGDAIRSFANTAAEDTENQARVDLDLNIFENFSRGFFESLKELLTDEERNSLALAPSMFAYMQTLRFLTDYLLNDPYYNTQYEKHNLVRTRNQLALFQSMKKKEVNIVETIGSIIGR